MARPQLWVFAGPNGAGKSTLADRFVRDRIPIVNPDNIARDLPRRPDGSLAELEAGKLALKERAERTADGRSFGFETTLSGQSELRAMRAASEAGYKVNLVFVGIPDANASANRVSERVGGGGHDVSTDDTDRRYPKSMANLPKAMSIADRSIIVDNSGRQHRLVMVRENEQSRVVGAMPQWARDAIPADLRRDSVQERRSLNPDALARANEFRLNDDTRNNAETAFQAPQSIVNAARNIARDTFPNDPDRQDSYVAAVKENVAGKLERGEDVKPFQVERSVMEQAREEVRQDRLRDTPRERGE